MRWSSGGYAHGLVVRWRLRLVGWPRGDAESGGVDIPFADPSSIPGGQRVIGYLLELWMTGVLHFEPADEEFVMLARRRPLEVLPGKPLEDEAPRERVRDDIGKARPRTVTSTDRNRLKRRMRGAISKKVIVDSDLEVDEIRRETGGPGA